MKVRAVKDGDIARITEIYNWYILNTTVSNSTISTDSSFLIHHSFVQSALEGSP
jgi:L-amino acid N-acyltransferase YncA